MTKGLAEDLVLAANSPELSTVIVRPRLIWGPGDTDSLPQLIAAVRSRRFAWIDGGHYLTSTCHAVVAGGDYATNRTINPCFNWSTARITFCSERG